ncbi:hypothetical protein HK096_000603, partial [Nowakowskiella sp. JEL0078]
KFNPCYMPMQAFIDLVMLSTMPGNTITVVIIIETSFFRMSQAVITMGQNA